MGCQRKLIRARCDFYFLITLVIVSPLSVRKGVEGREGMDGQAACDLGRGVPLAARRRRSLN